MDSQALYYPELFSLSGEVISKWLLPSNLFVIPAYSKKVLSIFDQL